VKPIHYVALTVGLTLIACGSFTQSPPPTVDIQATFERVRETLVNAPAPTEPPPADLPEEAILILTPGSGSRLVGEVHVEGIADSTFEQNLVIQVVALGEGQPEVIAQQPATIQVELGQRGPFAADIIFNLEGDVEQPGEVRVSSSSPRDGGLTHLASAQVTLAASGLPELRTADPHDELIVITAPSAGDTVGGGAVRVEGVGLASFEQTLLVELYDVDGHSISRAGVTVAAPDYGNWGPFYADLLYSVTAPGPARIVVSDLSPAFGQTLHLASVEVRLEP
jgi:hypothetical protein